MIVQGDLVAQYKEFVTEAMVAFLPLLSAVVGIFLCFAIAHQIVFFVKRSAKKA